MRSAAVQDGDPVTSVFVRGFFVTSLQVSCSDVTACSFTVGRVANSLLYWATYKIATFPPILFNKPPSPISRFHQKFIDSPSLSTLEASIYSPTCVFFAI